MSCLFQSIASRLQLEEGSVRKDICDYLEENASLQHNEHTLGTWIEESEGCTMQQYIESMRQNHVWGGLFEIMAAAQIYRVCIVVLWNGRCFEEINPTESARKIEIYYNGLHFW